MKMLKGGDEYFFELAKEDPVIVQIGMCHANLLYNLRMTLPQARIILYEPRHVKPPDVRICYYRKAVVGYEDGFASFIHYPENPRASCVGLEGDPCFGPANHYHVPCVSMEHVFKENDLVEIDVLLLDCEGSEFGILQEILAKKLPITQIHVEVDLARGNWDVLQKFLLIQYDLIQEIRLLEPDPSPLFLFRRKANA